MNSIHKPDRSQRGIRDLLQTVYAPSQAAEAAQRIQSLVERFAEQCGAPGHAKDPTGLTERDVLLITYPDQVSESGQAPLGTLAAFCEACLRDVVSGIHVLPFYPWSSDDGFAVKDYLAVEPTLGTWEDVSRLGRSFDLMFDAVINHMSAQSEWFKGFLSGEDRYRDFFVTVEGCPDLTQVVRPRALPLLTEAQTSEGVKRVWTTFSADQVDLNYRNPEVLLAILEVLLHYVQRGARFVRLDAIAFLWKEIGTNCLHLPQTHAIVRLLRAVLDEVAPSVRLITETNVPHRENLSYFGDGKNEAHMVYNFALPPLVLHSFVSGNAAKLTRWAQSLVLPSDSTTFFNFLASHDGIGLNPARGILGDDEIEGLVNRASERGGFVSYKDMPDGSRMPYELNVNYLDALGDPGAQDETGTAARKLLTAYAIMFSLQGVPGIYFHSLFGLRGDRVGAEASGIPRRINREKLTRYRLENELREPSTLASRVFAGMKELLGVRRTRRAFHPQAHQEILAVQEPVFCVHRRSLDDSDELLCLHNVSNGTIRVCPHDGLSGSLEGWDILVGSREDVNQGKRKLEVHLEPHTTIWLGRSRNSL